MIIRRRQIYATLPTDLRYNRLVGLSRKRHHDAIKYSLGQAVGFRWESDFVFRKSNCKAKPYSAPITDYGFKKLAIENQFLSSVLCKPL